MGTKLQTMGNAVAFVAILAFIALAFVPVSTYRWARYGSRFGGGAS